MKPLMFIFISLCLLLPLTGCFTKQAAETKISPSFPVQTTESSTGNSNLANTNESSSIFVNTSQPSPIIVTVYENAEFTEAEKAKLAELIAKIPADIQQQFSIMYTAWKDTWDDPELAAQSNPRAWTISDEYKDLLQFCQAQGQTVWLLAIKHFLQDTWFISKNLLFDLTQDEYRYIIDDIREESIQKRWDGEYSGTSAEDNARKYAKAILDICAKLSPDQTTGAGFSTIQPSPTIETVEESIEFTESEKAELTELIAQISAGVQEQFSIKYEAWNAIWDDPKYAVYSDARVLTRTEEYRVFLQFCQEQGKTIWPMLFQRVVDGDTYYIIGNAVYDLTLDEYKDIAEKIRLESHRYSEDGKQYIIPAAGTGLKKYVKALMALLY